MRWLESSYLSFFFNDTATTEIYTLSLHDALPICDQPIEFVLRPSLAQVRTGQDDHTEAAAGQASIDLAAETVAHAKDRKSTRLNSSHANISYAVFCLKKKRI